MSVALIFRQQPRNFLPVYWRVKLYVDRLRTQASDRLPEEKTISTDLGLDRLILRRCLLSLCRDGILYKGNGSEYYIQGQKVSIPVRRYNSYSLSMRRSNLEPQSQVLGIDVVSMQGELSAIYQSSTPDAQLWAIDLLRYRDGSPISVVRMFLRHDITPKLGVFIKDNVSISDLLEKEYGITPQRNWTCCEAVACDSFISKRLNVPLGAPLLKANSLSSWENKPFEYTISFFRSDRCQVRFEVP